MSDDCSTDNTVDICRDWIETHKNRFVRTDLLTIEKNTGVSANCNRAEAACRGDWVKVIAGDDLLLPNCIQDCVNYVSEHPDTIYLFGKCESFGLSSELCKKIDKRFDYTFFSLSLKEQLYRLNVVGNCIPAATAFYHRERVLDIGVTNDERIPLLEDWPKWINLLNAGVRFEFIDKVIIKYRVCEQSLSTSSKKSAGIIRSEQLLYKYYRFKYEYEHANKKVAIEKYLRAQKIVSQNVFWVIVFKLYKIVIMHKLH